MSLLNKRSRQIRLAIIALSKSNGGYHYGGSFSCVEILITLYDHVLTPDDQFILSKGHSCWPLYVLLGERGLNPKLAGHPERDPHNGIWCSTGSLGHGLPMAVGMAWAKKIKDEPGRIYVLMGDGECQTGTTWESMLIASRLGLDNLKVVVDWNGIQGSDQVENVLPLTAEYLLDVADTLGWATEETDGHDIDCLKPALCSTWAGPALVVAHTVKGKGVSFMEGQPRWHSCWLKPDQEAVAVRELA